MPNLENLRKQAKQYLRWHRERYYPVAARIRAAL
ncbi:MAG TPA: VOC family protein, partial [Candidatus Angelobacter sp.]|nr:VOC family protein [Candidatus Angelobacter sp.]